MTALFANEEDLMTFKQEVDRAYQRYQKECGLHLKWTDLDWRAQEALSQYHNIATAA